MLIVMLVMWLKLLLLVVIGPITNGFTRHVYCEGDAHTFVAGRQATGQPRARASAVLHGCSTAAS